jgi:Leucine-rich repeat (LRR) protein
MILRVLFFLGLFIPLHGFTAEEQKTEAADNTSPKAGLVSSEPSTAYDCAPMCKCSTPKSCIPCLSAFQIKNDTLTIMGHKSPKILLKKLERWIWLSANRLRTLNIVYCGLSDKDVVNLFNVLKGNAANLETLNLTGNLITGKSLEHLIYNCKDGAEGGVLSFIKKRESFSKLQRIMLHGNPLGAIGDINHLKQATTNGQFCLHLGFNSPSTLNWTNEKELQEFLARMPDYTFKNYEQIQKLIKVLRSNYYDPVLLEDQTFASVWSLSYFAEFVSKHGKQPLQAITLDGTNLGMVRVTQILKLLDDQVVTKISLKGAWEDGKEISNTPTADQRGNFLETLQKFKKLTSLELGGNFFGEVPEILEVFGPAIKEFSKLHYLGLSGNNLRAGDLGAFIDNIPTSVTVLDLSRNGLIDDHLDTVIHPLISRKGLLYLDLSGNQLTLENKQDALMKAFSEEHVSLKVLHLNENPIQKEARDFLEAAYRRLEKNPQLPLLVLTEPKETVDASTEGGAEEKKEAATGADPYAAAPEGVVVGMNPYATNQPSVPALSFIGDFHQYNLFAQAIGERNQRGKRGLSWRQKAWVRFIGSFDTTKMRRPDPLSFLASLPSIHLFNPTIQEMITLDRLTSQGTLLSLTLSSTNFEPMRLWPIIGKSIQKIFDALLGVLKKNIHMKHLDLSGNNLDKTQMRSLFGILKTMTSLTTLTIKSSKVSPKEMRAFMKELTNANPHLVVS